jgi:hypothetical protein
MSLKADLRAHLKASPAVASEVHWNTRPQASPFPAVVLQVIDEAVLRDLDGANGTKSARVQFHCMATTATEADTIRQAVLAKIEGSHTVGDTTFTLQGEPAWFDQGTNTATGFVHKCLVDARFFHNG